MRVVGLTGGIASGKSTVSALLQRHGFLVIDCDELAHAVCSKASMQRAATLAAVGTHARALRLPRVACVTFGPKISQQMVHRPTLQGRWGYKRVVAAFGSGILGPDGAWVGCAGGCINGAAEAATSPQQHLQVRCCFAPTQPTMCLR